MSGRWSTPVTRTFSWYCAPADHIWVRVVAGKTYAPDYTTDVCVTCGCHQSVRNEETP